MANKTDFRVDLTASDKTSKAFSSLQQRMNNVGKSIGGATVSIAKWGAATVAAAGAATIALTKMRMDAVDNIAKTADKLGVATEALVGLQHAAEISGVSTETMNMALQRMTRRVAEAAVGTGEAKGALQELGINAVELQKLPLDKQMQVVADAMQGVGTQADRVRLAMKLFDSEGVALVNTMKGGSAGLKEMAKEAEQLGITISRVDAAKIEEANDSVVRAKGVFTGLGNQLAVAFSPIVTHVADSFRQAALDSADFGNIGQKAARALAKGFGFLMDAVQGLKAGFYALSTGWAKFAQMGMKAISFLAEAFNVPIAIYNKLAEMLGKPLITNGIVQFADTAAAELDRLANENWKNFQDVVAQPLPSEGIMATFDAIQVKARETAEVVAKSVIPAGQDKPQKSLSDTDKAKMEGAQKLAEFQKKTTADKTKFVIGQMAEELQGVSAHSKKLFALQKAMQIGQAIMNTYTAATKALASYPPPLNAIFAGMAVATGLAQVAQIRAQSFEGGGYTGRGARAGGLDGKGGYMAMVHPNESIIDHTKGQGQGITIVNNVDATGGGADMDQKIRAAMEVTSQQTVAQVQNLLRRQRMV